MYGRLATGNFLRANETCNPRHFTIDHNNDNNNNNFDENRNNTSNAITRRLIVLMIIITTIPINVGLAKTSKVQNNKQ